MRNKLILMIMILFVSFVLVGCDLFGNNDSTTTDKITSSQTLSPTTTITSDSNNIYYTVIFKDYDGTELNTQTVEKNKAAIPPADPTRADEQYFSYAFAGWSQDFSNVQGDMTIYATYSKTYNSTTTFSHEILFNLVKRMMNDEETITDQQVEDQIDWLLDITDAFNEHQLYDMMMTASQMMQDLQNVSDLDDFNSWITNAKTTMLDRNTLIDSIYALLVQKINNEMQMKEYYLTELFDVFDENYDYMLSKAQIISDIQDYLDDNGGAYKEIAQQYFDARCEIDDLELAYDYIINFQETPEGFDWDTYYLLENLQENYLEEFYLYQNNDRADDFLSQYNDLYDSLSPEEQAMYNPFLDAFVAWKIAENIFSHDTLMDIVYDDLYNSDASEIAVKIEDFYSQYHDINKSIRDNYDFIFNALGRDWETEMENLQNSLNGFENTYNYIFSADGMVQVKALMSLFYDNIENIQIIIDEDTFEMMMDIVNGQLDLYSLLDTTNTDSYIQIVEIANKLNQILYILGFDADGIIDTYLEVYYNENYASSYDPLDLANLQSGWETFIDDILTQIADVGSMNSENLSENDILKIIELQEKIAYLQYLFINPEVIL